MSSRKTDRVLFSDKEVRSLVAYVASLGSGPAIPHPDPARGSVSAGLEQFTLHCAGCHQALAEGGFVTGARVPPLHTVPATQIAEAVRIGPYLMPRFSTKQISDAQLNSIIRYVQSQRHPTTGAAGDRQSRADPRGAGRVVDRRPPADPGLPVGLEEEAPMKLWQWLLAFVAAARETSQVGGPDV